MGFDGLAHRRDLPARVDDADARRLRLGPRKIGTPDALEKGAVFALEAIERLAGSGCIGWRRISVRSCSARSVPPGSRVTTTWCPRAPSESATNSTCVDLPAPSTPSRLTNLPRMLIGRRAGTC